MSLSMFHALWTVLLVAIFIGIVAWAYSSKRRDDFDAAARLPLEDGEQAAPPTFAGENRHG